MDKWLIEATAIVVAAWMRYGQVVDGCSCYGGYDRQVTAVVGIVWWVPANPSAMTLHIHTVTSIGLCLISTQWCLEFDLQPT